MDPGTDRHGGTIRRVLVWHAVLGAAGLLGWLWHGGRVAALSFLVGALAASASFWLLIRFVNALGGDTGRPATVIASALRVLLIGGALFVIMHYYNLQTNALATGVGITVVAITIEAIREYA